MSATNVRMAEMIVSTDPGAELVALGLGSCIGLAIVDPAARVAGLAHIVLPEARGAAAPVAKSADLAVPQLIRLVQDAGGARRRLLAAIVGGAKMFDLAGGMDIGARNCVAVRTALKAQGLAVSAEATGGGRGRTISVQVAGGTISYRCAGDAPTVLLDPAASIRRPLGTPGRAGRPLSRARV